MNEETHAAVPSSPIKKVLAVIGVVAGYVVVGLLSAAPIVAFAAWQGGLRAFVVMGLIYGFGSYFITMWACGLYERYTHGKPSKVAEWFEDQKNHSIKDGNKVWLWRIAETGGFVGFAFACFALGSIMTVFLVNYGTKVENLQRLAAVGSLIFAITYAGFYSGAFALITSR